MVQYLITLVLCMSATVLAIPSKIANDKRIANGYTAARYQFPYIASYQHLGLHFCGCSIISEYWLVTAAHCVDQAKDLSLDNLLVVAGIITLNTLPPYRQSTKVLRQYRHPSYAGGTTPNDIGLIRVVTPFKWTTDVGYIFLPYPDDDYNGLTQISGWGYLRSSYPAPSPQLQFANGFIITTYDCNTKVYSYGATVDYRSICTVGYNKGNETSCKGDSGGPLTFYNNNGYAILIGVVVWNLSPCGLNGTPSVSTKVSKYIPWISCRINNDISSPTTIC